MKEKELRNELIDVIQDTMNLTNLYYRNLSLIDRFGRELLEELQLIKGWEIMLTCNPELFDSSSCAVDYEVNAKSVIFKKEGIIYLTIRLDLELIEQVVQATEIYGQEIRRPKTRGLHISIERP